MDYETQNAIDSAMRDCQSKIDDVRWSLERDVEQLKRDVSRLEERCDYLKSELRAEREDV